MRKKSVSHVGIVFVSLFLPIILHSQELTADVVIHRTNGEDAKGKLYKGGNAVRLEPPEEGDGAVKGTVVIYDLARQVTYFLNPAMKAYVERPGSAWVDQSLCLCPRRTTRARFCRASPKTQLARRSELIA